MAPIYAAWYMMSGTCLAMGLVHLLIGLRRRQEPHFILVGVSAVAIAVIGIVEARIMSAGSVSEVVRWLRFAHVPIFLMLVGLVGFVHLFFGTGRTWLACTVVALRALVLLATYLSPVNANYLEVRSIATISLLGESVTVVGDAVTNPWTRVATLSLFLFVVYTGDAALRLWRRGDSIDRRRAALVGGGIVATIVLAGATSALKHEGLVLWPYVITPAYLFILCAIGYELAWDMLRAGELAHRLNLAEQRVELATMAAGIGTWEWQPKRNELWFSDTTRMLLGLGTEQPIAPDRFFGELHRDGDGSIRAEIERAVGSGRDFDLAARILRAPSESRWVALRGRVGFDEQRRAEIVRGVVFDISERKGAEERLRIIAEGSPNAFIMVDAEGDISYCNARALALFGYGSDELLGRPIELLIPHDSRVRHEVYRRDSVHQDASGPMREGSEVHARCKDGGEIPVEVWLTSVRLRDEPLVLVNVIDISVRRKAELELAQQRNELTHLSRVNMLGELSGSLAHELNQPLTSILLNAQATRQMFQSGSLSPETLDEILLDIVEDSKRAGEVIRRLRSLVRRSQIERESLSANTLVLDVLRLVRSDLVGRAVSVTTDLAPNLPSVFGDRVQLQQVLLNLVLNACDAMEHAQRPCTLSVRTSEDPDGSVRFLVIDQGIGIEPEHIGRIFEPFMTTKARGMGLGLSVCRSIVEHHGGTIGARNNEQAGATVYFTVPALQGH